MRFVKLFSLFLTVCKVDVNIKNYGINSGTVSLLLINIAPNSIVAVKKPVNHFHCSFFTPVTSLIIILYFFLATLNLPEKKCLSQ